MMQGFRKKNSSNNAARDAYLEFKFSDGVMVDCSDMDRSWNQSSVFSDDLSMISAAVGQKAGGRTGDCIFNWNSWPEESCHERVPKNIALLDRKQSIPKDIASQNRKPCMSSLGIHMCDCEEDSISCNLVTGMASSLDKKISTVEKPSQDKAVSYDTRIKDNDCSNSGSASRKKQGSDQCARALTWSSSSKGARHNERASRIDFGNKSAIAAWAAVVSETPCSSLIPSTGLAVTVNPKKGSRSVNCKERVPTLASHLELTENALSQGKLCSNYGENMGNILALQNAPWHASSAICSTLNSQFAGLKLDVGNLSIREPVPYGTLHGVLHCTLKDGLPNYTFLLDDYEDVLTAKIWFEDIRLGHHQEIWKYSFYSLREEKKRKGKSGWKNWRKKDKIIATLVGKLKVSSVLCSEETHTLSVKSECILFSSRLNDSAPTVEGTNGSTQARMGDGETHYCNDPDCTVGSLPSSASAPIMSSLVSAFYGPSSVATAAWQSSTPTKFPGADVAPRSCRNPTIQRTTCDADTEALTPSPGTSHQHSELAAIMIDVPLKMQDKLVKMKEQHPEASITVILPSGNHGRPLHDLKGPSPLISRWKEGGKCDCKGWDLGCGLMVYRNSKKKTEMCRRVDDEEHSRSLRLYKQDTDQEEISFSLAPQENGLVAVDFCYPLSPLQAFAIAVATLHGRDSKAAMRVHTVCTRSPCFPKGTSAEEMCGKNGDRSSMEKENWNKSPAKGSVNSNRKQTWQPQIAMENSFVKVHASELAFSFERV